VARRTTATVSAHCFKLLGEFTDTPNRKDSDDDLEEEEEERATEPPLTSYSVASSPPPGDEDAVHTSTDLEDSLKSSVVEGAEQEIVERKELSSPVAWKDSSENVSEGRLNT
jgi:hypothetical protein